MADNLLEDYDFSGWATKANMLCSDGRTIMKDAFKHNDGKIVPLVWNHNHASPQEVLGKALLINHGDGVRTYGKFNETESGLAAKELVLHGDVDQLSIYANRLQESGKNVCHGDIKEVSLVLAGANPGAFIDTVIKHGEECEGEGFIFTGEEISLHHSDDDVPPKKDDEEPPVKKDDEEPPKKDDGDPPPKKDDEEPPLNKDGDPNIKHSDSQEGESSAEVFETLNDKQKNLFYGLVGQIAQGLDEGNDGDGDPNIQHSDNSEGGNTMKHNVFDASNQDSNKNQNGVLTHAQMGAIITDAKRFGSLKETVLAHAADYGIENIEFLFPDAKNYTNEPQFINRDTTWVGKFMSGVHHTPFSRIKSMFADITEDAARAKGYLKGKLKKEEVFSLLKRTTTPQTIYKKQKLDRDDVIDITDFDVVAWLKAEMRGKLDEEIAQAGLIGDQRLASDDDKINEQNIRPIAKDDELYTIQAVISAEAAATEDDIARAFIRTCIKSRKDYKGSGSPSLWTTEDVVTDCLLLEDKTGRQLYDSVDKLATALRVKEIISVPVMEGAKGKNEKPLMGIIVNLVDYNIGADKGGAVNMFEDFDIDYNQQKYLIETRCSGALVKPYSAIAITLDKAVAF